MGLQHVISQKKSRLVTILIALVILLVSLIVATDERKAYAVLVDNKQIAVVESRTEAEKSIQDLKDEKTKELKKEVTVKQQIKYKETLVPFYQLDSINKFEKFIDKEITFATAGTGIKINGKVSLVLKNKKDAEKVLEKLKSSFVQDGLPIDTVKFEDEVKLVEVPTELGVMVNVNEAVEKIQNGLKKNVIYEVGEGDSLWSIATKNSMTVEELKTINPDLEGEKLKPGQELNLIKPEPLIDVIVEGQITKKETIKHKVLVQNDKTLWRGRQKVKQTGQDGSKEVTYKVVFKNGLLENKSIINEKILEPAEDKIVLRGSKQVVVSRQGSGKFGWPIKGKINSPYGPRWGKTHTGLDIAGNTGQPIGAAGDGRVVFAGWDGGYGKSVRISHGGGIITRYAHMSKIEVKKGQQVKRGDLVGLVGSTGISTGPHLHFEVLVNGSTRNPMTYLN